MIAKSEPILLGTEMVSGGLTRATFSIKAGTRVHVWILPEAYAAGALVNTRTRVQDWFSRTTGTVPYT